MGKQWPTSVSRHVSWHFWQSSIQDCLSVMSVSFCRTNSLPSDGCRSIRRPSEPNPHAENECRAVYVLALVARESRRFADLPLVFHADVGRELRHELVAQPKPGLDRRQPRAAAGLADVLRGEFELGTTLEDPFLADDAVVRGFHTGQAGTDQDRTAGTNRQL